MIDIDIETYSELDVTEVGSYRYAEHPSTRILVICWQEDDGPMQTWTWMDGTPMPTFHRADLCAWNSEFERAVLDRFHLAEDARWFDAAAQAAMCGLPRKLEKAADALELPVRKDKRGRLLIQKLSKPQRPTKTNPHTLPHERWPDYRLLLNEFAEYCARDVEVSRAVRLLLPPLPPAEQEVYWLTMRMNARGVAVDLGAVRAAQELVARVTGDKGARVQELTGFTHKQLDGLLDWLASCGVVMESLDKAAVSAALRRKNLPDDAREVLELRQELAKSSTAKLDSILDRVCSDGRVRGNLVYHGAQPGRWAGAGLQVQNIVRTPPGLDQDEGIGAILLGDCDWIEALWGMRAPEFVSANLRGMLCAAPGSLLAGADYSSIEARVVLWIAQDEGLQYFRDGVDIYVEMAKDIGPEASRQLGKQAVLGCGFGMGPPKFRDTCAGYGIEIDDELAKRAVFAYRTKFPRVPMLWAALENAALMAVRNPGRVYSISESFVSIRYRFDGERFLTATLPSGRRLYYPFPKIEPGRYGPQLTYMGVDGKTKQWRREHTYGGKLTENVVQAVARDLMAGALLRLDADGYRPIFSVHDEAVCEVDERVTTPADEIAEIMCELPGWAAGLPVAAEGFAARRYS